MSAQRRGALIEQVYMQCTRLLSLRQLGGCTAAPKADSEYALRHYGLYMADLALHIASLAE
jgi:hypothetical protein